MEGLGKNSISVVIATYNRCGILKGVLESLLCQERDGSFDYEIIVVDNNSTDKTREVTEEYMRKFSKSLRYFFEPRQGKSNALKKGIEEAKGEIIAFTDDDVTVDKKWLQKISDIFSKRDIDLLGGKVIPYFGFRIPKWLEDYEKSLLKYPLMYYDLGYQYIENTDMKILPIGANMSIRKASCFKFGGYLPGMSRRAQDIEFCNRWHKQGAKIAYSSEVEVLHHINQRRATKNYYRSYFLQTGKDHARIFNEKYTTGRHFLNAPLWLLKDLILNMLKVVRGFITFDKNNFLTELTMWHTFGIIFALKSAGTD